MILETRAPWRCATGRGAWVLSRVGPNTNNARSTSTFSVFHRLQKDKQRKQRHSLCEGRFQTQLLYYFFKNDNKSNHHLRGFGSGDRTPDSLVRSTWTSHFTKVSSDSMTLWWSGKVTDLLTRKSGVRPPELKPPKLWVYAGRSSCMVGAYIHWFPVQE